MRAYGVLVAGTTPCGYFTFESFTKCIWISIYGPHPPWPPAPPSQHSKPYITGKHMEPLQGLEKG